MSNTVTSVFLPEGGTFMRAERYEARGYVVYSGQGKYLDLGMFQMPMGRFYEEDCRVVLKVLKDVSSGNLAHTLAR